MIQQLLTLTCLMILSASALKEAIDKASFELKSNWEFKSVEDQEWLPAKVPGLFHLDMLENEKITDPFYRDGIDTWSYLISRDWEYRVSFTLPANLTSRKFIRFAFHGLDTHAFVSLNGKPFHESHSQFNRYYVPLDDRSLLPNQIDLYILFNSSSNYNFEKSRNIKWLEGDNPHMWSRKAAYQWGWDFAPKFCVAGVWKPIIIEAFDSATIEYAYPYLKQKSQWSLIVGLELEIAAFSPGNYSFSLDIFQYGLNLTNTTISPTLNVSKAGNYTIVHEIQCFGSIQLWYPNRFNRTQNLYDFEFKLIKDGEVVIDKKTVRSGMRTVELVQQPDRVNVTDFNESSRTDEGKSFKFRINGEEIFVKGSNWVPPDAFMTRMTHDKYRKYAKLAKESNFNMLRIWGGGQYEDDVFYEALDENGIMVWQDFMFANGIYPASDEYNELMKVEFEQQIKRLRIHPSIVLWCGNNEIKEGLETWRWDRDPENKVWYDKIFKELIPQALSTFDKASIPYWESSPSLSWANESSQAQGDSHQWEVWHGGKEVEWLGKILPRFVSEFGIPSVPNFEIVKKFTAPEDRQVQSKMITKHHMARTWIPYENYLGDYYVRDKAYYYREIEIWIYATQIMQAMVLQTGIEHYRRGQPVCMGVLYWQFNDCWPVLSWSTVDYYFTWKAAHYKVKKYYENVILSTVENSNKDVEIYLICDSGDFLGVLDMEIYGMDGAVYWKRRTGLRFQCPSSTLVYTLKVAPFFEKIGGRNRTVLRSTVRHYFKWSSDREGIKFEHFHYFERPKALNLEEPVLSLNIDRASKELVLKAENIVKDMMIYMKDDLVELEENYFDMAPGEKRIRFKEGSFAKVAGDVSKIKYMTLWDSNIHTSAEAEGN